MKKAFLYSFFYMLLTAHLVHAQEFTKEQQYQQVMENAKVAFEAGRYSQAVMFYRQAQELNPKSHLPRYKIEDIRTIYIERELADQPEAPKRLNKKEQAAQEALEEEAREVATRKMNADADLALAELTDLKMEKEVPQAQRETLEVDDELDDLPEEEVQDSERHVETVGAALTKKPGEQFSLPDSSPEIKTEKREVKPLYIAPEAELLEVDEEETVLEEDHVNDPEQHLAVVPPAKPQQEAHPVKGMEKPVIEEQVVKKEEEPLKLSDMTEEEREAFIESEQVRLKKEYPNAKTVEELEKPGRHITRVIMHVDGKVTIYLKVKHSWGATFFFMDNPGLELQSINEIYFNKMTNLLSYGS